ncbi:MAG: type IX secretion system protein PorQ [Chitinophagales bacterium]|nr:type IX secretion system protein PorQ [Chitinophagales bacterium]
MRLIFLLLSITMCCSAFGQIGGENTYEFLNLPVSARSTATGGSLITVNDGDLSLAYHNPSVLNSTVSRHLSASVMNYFGGINFGNVSYAQQFGMATYQAGIQFISYGTLDRTDVTGTVLGTFQPSEYAMFIGAGIPYGKYSFGSNLKFIYSDFTDYKSYGTALDLAANWTDTARMVTVSLVLRNMGFQIKPYEKGNSEGLPFDVQLGISKRLSKLPFRINLILHNLYRWDIAYYDPASASSGSQFGFEEDTNEPGFADKLFRHVIVGGELYFGKAVRVGFGYNHLRRQELKLTTKTGLAGYSFGLGINIKQFQINYALGKYHPATGAHHFTLNTNLGSFIRSKKG